MCNTMRELVQVTTKAQYPNARLERPMIETASEDVVSQWEWLNGFRYHTRKLFR